MPCACAFPQPGAHEDPRNVPGCHAMLMSLRRHGMGVAHGLWFSTTSTPTEEIWYSPQRLPPGPAPVVYVWGHLQA
jgi:hypothetical protein